MATLSRVLAVMVCSCLPLQPFDAPPALQVSFVAAETRTGYKLPLNLPTPPNVFMEAIPMDAATFNARWGALADKVRGGGRAGVRAGVGSV